MGSTASLLNFTVPLEGNQSSISNQGLIMPKLKYRFRAIFVGFGISNTSEMTKQVMDFKRPTVDFDAQTIDIYNSKIHYVGKPTWSDCTLTLRDDMQGNIQRLVGEQIQKQFDFLNQSSASSAVDYKFEVLLQTLDGGNAANNPVVLETWDLVGCLIKAADYDQADYKASDPLLIKLTVTLDNALQSIGGDNGVGASVVRTLGEIAI